MEEQIKSSEKDVLFHDVIDHIHDLLDNHLNSPHFEIFAKKYAIRIIIALKHDLDIDDKDIQHEREKIILKNMFSLGSWFE